MNSHLPFELFAGLRYIRSRKRSRFVSFISATSAICIAIGVATLITVLSVMNGFELEVRSRLLSMVPHATISGAGNQLDDWQSVAAQAMQNPAVAATAPYIEGEVLLRGSDDLTGTMLRGVLPAAEERVSEVGRHMVAGKLEDLKPGGYGTIIGEALAQSLNVKLGDSVDMMIPQLSGNASGFLPSFRRMRVVGIFKLGLYEFDHGLVLVDLQDAQAMYHMGDSVTGLQLSLHDMFAAPRVVREIARQLPQVYYISDWTRQHANFFRAVASQKQVMFLILSLLVGLATFNIVSTLVMMVQDKQSDIAILRTIGATPRSIMAIFIVQGSMIGTIGTVFGVALGVLLALNVETLVPLLEHAIGHHFIDPAVYMISDLPSHLDVGDVIRIAALSLALGLVSTLYPAWRASRVLPAEALRYE